MKKYRDTVSTCIKKSINTMSVNSKYVNPKSMSRKLIDKCLSRFLKEENGATLVYVAITMVVLLGMAALALDGSNLYLQRRNMQNAADAAALSGIHVLASGGTKGEARSEVHSFAGQNDAIAKDVDIQRTSVALNAERSVETYFARIFNINSVDVDAYSKVEYTPIYSLEPPPFCFEAACVREGQTVTVVADEAQTYCADSLDHWSGGPRSALYIHNPEPDTVSAVDYDDSWMEFDRVGSMGVYRESLDGTATLTMDVMNGHNRGFAMEVRFFNRSNHAPNSNSPYTTSATSNSPVSTWHYYSDWELTLTGLAGTPYAGAEIDGYGYSNGGNAGAAFQVGQGATYYRGDKFGASGWAWLKIRQQPSSGIKLLGPTGWSASDIYLELEPCNHLADNSQSTVSAQSCKFNFLDWNGDVDSADDIADQIRDRTQSGRHTVGETVAGADWYSDRSPIESALSEWFDQTVPVPVCGDRTNDGNFEILGFTGFRLEEMDFSAFPSAVRGTFEPVLVDSPPVPDGVVLTDYLARDITLIE